MESPRFRNVTHEMNKNSWLITNIRLHRIGSGQRGCDEDIQRYKEEEKSLSLTLGVNQPLCSVDKRALFEIPG